MSKICSKRHSKKTVKDTDKNTADTKDTNSLLVITNFFQNFDCYENNKLIENKKHFFFGDLKSMFNVHLIKNYFDKDYADKLFNDLTQIQYNSDEESMIRMPRGLVKIPRQQTAYGEPGTTYHFSGISVMSRDWTVNDGTIDTHVGNELQYISQLVGRSACSKFNYALINNYHDQTNSIGYHSDDEKELGRYPKVAGISLGQEREMFFKSKLNGEVIKVSLPHNSLVIMHYPTNKFWQHTIPKKTQHLGQRISITFRSVDETLLKTRRK
jgi:alkylated DNA repair dioxygenase AlkB